MAVAQLLRSKQRFNVRKIGVPGRRRCSSSSSSSSGEDEQSSRRKKLEAAKEQHGAVTGESDVNKFMAIDPGVLPTQTQVGGTFRTVRNIVAQLKEKLRGHFQLQNHGTSLMSDSKVDTSVPDITPHTCPDNAEVGQAKGILQSSEAFTSSLICVKNITKNETPNMMPENTLDCRVNATLSEVSKIPDNQENTEFRDTGSLLKFSETREYSLGNDKNILVGTAPLEIEKHCSEDMVSKTASEVSKVYNNLDRTEDGENMMGRHSKASKMYNYLDRSEVGETLTTIQSPEFLVDSDCNKENVSTSMMGENPSADIAKSEETHDTSKLVGPGSQHVPLSKIMRDKDFMSNTKQKKDFMSKYPKYLFVKEDTSKALPKDGLEKLTANGNEHCQHNEKITSGQLSSAGTEDGGNMAPSGSALKVMELPDIYAREINTPAPLEKACQKGLALTLKGFSEDPNKTSRETLTKSSDLGSLIDFIKELPNEQIVRESQDNIFNQTSKVSNRVLPMQEKRGRSKDQVGRIQSSPDLQRSDCRGGLPTLKTIFEENSGTDNFEKVPWLNTLFKKCEENSKSDEEEEVQWLGVPSEFFLEYMNDDANRCHSEFEANAHTIEPNVTVPCSTSKDPDENPDASPIGEGSGENKMLMRFLLKSTSKSEILSALKDCGPIAKISELCSVKGSNFKDAHVYFKTRAGLQKALEKTDLAMENIDVIMEGPSSLEINSSRVPIPDLIGDPDVPRALVKNPIRTAMIKGLTLSMNWKHLEKALSPRKGITGFIMGSSSSVAYVEFETEDDKENAIAEHSFQVLGKSLQVFRIDAPRTTVARISNINTQEGKRDIRSVCSQYGKVKNIVRRNFNTMDVHFKLEEWPNMLRILNSLNGQIVDDNQWVARPATVYPPEILRALWSQPDGREHVKSVICTSLQKIGTCHIDVSQLADLAAQYYEDG